MIQRESMATCWSEIKVNFDEHWKEVCCYQEKVKPGVDEEAYRQAEKALRLLIMTAREGGELVGYATFFVASHMHHKKHMVAYSDMIYVQIGRRRGTRIGLELIEESEKELWKFGVDRIIWGVKSAIDWSPILTRKGYILEERLYSKLKE